jgi:RNA polymerase sigma factor (sigma-70 family)
VSRTNRAKHDVRNLSDETLARAKSGDRVAMAEVFRAAEGLIRWRASTYRVDEDTREDLRSIGRLAMFDAVRTYRPNKGHFAGWMTQWVHASMWSSLERGNKRARWLTEFLAEPTEAAPGADEVLAEEAQCAELRMAVAKLPARLRAVMTGRLEGKTLAAIGRETDYSRERVRQLEAVALEKLRRTMEAA